MGPTRRPSLGECAVDVAFIGDHQPEEAKNFWTETKLFLELAIPTSFLGLGFTLSPLLTASYVGLRFGPVFLSAFTLGNLTGNLCTFSLLAGLLSAADTLGPQAFGVGDYREVGLIALRGIFASIIIILPINVLLVLHMEKALVAVGQDPEAAFHASEWYRVFVYALPFVVLYQVTWKFLSAQHVMRPLIYVSVFSCLLVLPLALEYCTAYYGFVGSATAYVIFQASQSLLLILYIAVCKPHVAETWPGLGCWREALKVKQLMEYLNLGGGGILCQSEWIYWEALGLMVGNMGVVPLSAHTIPNQITMIMCMIPFSFGTALAIRMGHILPKSVVHTKHIAVVMTLISSVLMALIALLAYVEADWIFALFTKDAEVLAMAHSIWWKTCLFNFIVSVFGLLNGVATGLGLQWSVGCINIFCLWGFAVPITYYLALVRGGGLSTVWTWINVPYTCMNISLIVLFIITDWYKVQNKVNDRDLNGTDKDPGMSRVNGTSHEADALLGSSKVSTAYGAQNC